MLAATPAFAEDGHNHANEENHFEFEKPATIEDAWTMLDAASAEAHKAIEAKDPKSLHETSEKLEAAVGVLNEHPDAVAEEKRENLKAGLNQLSKTVDRFHHAAEDNDIAGATEALELLESQKTLVRSLYTTNGE